MSGSRGPLARARPAERLLLVLAAGLLVLALLLLLVPTGGEPPVARFALNGHAAADPGGAAATADADAATALARPLFAPGRRPPAVAAAGPVQLPRLAGVIVGQGIAAKAIFAAEGDAKPPVLGVGQSIAGHVIRAIGPDSVTLQDGAVLHPTFAMAAPVAGADPGGAGSGGAGPAALPMPPPPPPPPNGAAGPMMHRPRGL